METTTPPRRLKQPGLVLSDVRARLRSGQQARSLRLGLARAWGWGLGLGRAGARPELRAARLGPGAGSGLKSQVGAENRARARGSGLPGSGPSRGQQPHPMQQANVPSTNRLRLGLGYLGRGQHNPHHAVTA
jgi:hypothetical protein